ncbi:YceI family protein [Flavobacterium agricola]|uniref:YceI family protein n=1 Tax=Flavobacterium agricola TaxID=2870839 RepID=A0ABY6M377_9FLAO|nr:YceI family protein [Flavobacterium agricola]UYW01915.1 YceI family protein [Flavobacterium agricola]
MKKTIILSFAVTAFLISCKGSTGDKTVTTDAQEVAAQTGASYNVNKEQSDLKWKGYHKGGLNPRFGTLKTDGTVSVDNGAVTGGTFTIEIKTIATDEASVDPVTSGGKTAADLTGHLLSADFFESDVYPTASFEITSVAPFDAASGESVVADANSLVSGNLTIKDKTVNVTFPARITVSGDNVNIFSQFAINRQDWGLTYGAEGDPADWMISQEVDIELNVNATK